MIKILSLGNSFAHDATAYLHDMAEYANIKTKIVNLYIGGCSLGMHWENAENNLKNYDYELNGLNTGNKISIKEALLEDEWDFVTTQQASYDSGIIETYFPYITQLSDYIKKYSHNSKQYIHQTWAYEIDSTHSGFLNYQNNQVVMYKALETAYRKVSQIMGLELIPCGDVIQTLRSFKPFDYLNGGQSLCRDGFHMSLIYGRYAAAATWYMTILNKNIMENNFLPLSNENISAELVALIRQTVYQLCI